MRWRLIALALLGVACAGLVMVFAQQGVELQQQSQKIFATFQGPDQNPSIAEQERAMELSMQSYALQTAITPLGTGAVACGAGILLIQARRWERRSDG